jgi:hypothetical protein
MSLEQRRMMTKKTKYHQHHDLLLLANSRNHPGKLQ